MKRLKRGQEEMVGFALIIILVAVIILVFVCISLNKTKKQVSESYEIESFLNSMLQYSTNCGSSVAPSLSIQQLIFSCADNTPCIDGKSSCAVIAENVKNIANEAWPTKDSPNKGYDLEIIVNNQSIASSLEGNKTKNYRASSIPLTKSGKNVTISLEVYS